MASHTQTNPQHLLTPTEELLALAAPQCLISLSSATVRSWHCYPKVTGGHRGHGSRGGAHSPEGSLCFRHSTASWRESDDRASGQDGWGVIHLPLGASGKPTNYFVVPTPLTWLQIFFGCLPATVAFRRQKGLHPETVASLFPVSVTEGTAGGSRTEGSPQMVGSFPGPSEAHSGLLPMWLREGRPLLPGGGGSEAGGLGRGHSGMSQGVALE